MDSDYAVSVFEFVKDKSLEELNLFHWKRNFDLYFRIHSSFNFWANRFITVKVIKSHCLEESRTLLDRYEHLGNEFADIAAKTTAKDQGIVEFFQTRSSMWTYVEKAESDWKSFYEFCYGVAQTFLNADDLDPSPQVDNIFSISEQHDIGNPCPEPEISISTLTNHDLFDLGDPFHRRRQMSSYGATYNRCLLAF